MSSSVCPTVSALAASLCFVTVGCVAADPGGGAPAAKPGIEAPVISEDASDAYTRHTTILGTVEYDRGTTGRFAASGYVGFLFTGVAGSHIAIDVAVNANEDLDPVAFLYGPKGGANWNRQRPIAQNDDAVVGDLAGTLNSHIGQPIRDDGTYLLVVAEYNQQAGGQFGVRLVCDGGTCTKFCSDDSNCPTGSSCEPPTDCPPNVRCGQTCRPIDPSRACETDSDCAKINTGCCCPNYEAVNASYEDLLAPECPPIEHRICPAVMCAQPNEGAAACVENKCELVDRPATHSCGGFAGLPCPDGETCVDDPSDDCDPRNGGADCGGICIDREGEGCAIGGCSGQLCGAADGPSLISTCEMLPEYGCYHTATCEKRSDGQCGWTQTPELLECIDTARGLTDCRASGCGEGRYCTYCWTHYACIPNGAIC